MLKLGHIRYSNCVPVHGRFIECGPPSSIALIEGVPSELNRLLAEGEIDVAPASSIEFARHADRYRILADLSISARGPVHTVQVLSRSSIAELRDGARFALPTASATSVVLLKIVMSQRFGISPGYFWFEQETQDPFEAGAVAALYIGDRAYKHRPRPDLIATDLAAFWHDWTGLPFVFALWQTGADRRRDRELLELASQLRDSRTWCFERLPQLAERQAPQFGWASEALVRYWRDLRFDWDDELAAGLMEFYARSVEIGEIAAAPAPIFVDLA